MPACSKCSRSPLTAWAVTATIGVELWCGSWRISSLVRIPSMLGIWISIRIKSSTLSRASSSASSPLSHSRVFSTCSASRVPISFRLAGLSSTAITVSGRRLRSGSAVMRGGVSMRSSGNRRLLVIGLIRQPAAPCCLSISALICDWQGSARITRSAIFKAASSLLSCWAILSRKGIGTPTSRKS
ncbi:hypothetical protein D3C80_828700 [compost metagenome]